MTSLRYTLLSDGSSDRALIPVLGWLITQHLPQCAVQAEWADLRRVPQPPRGISQRIATALELYPCDLLFVHRDAEREPAERRLEEVEAAVREQGPDLSVPVVAVVPVRMHEAWLLFNEAAIRRAAGNPNGRNKIDLPPLPAVEREPDPKRALNALLRACSGLSGRRLQRFPVAARAVRVAEFISDFTPLRRLESFRLLEQQLTDVIKARDWCQGG
jgi:hypothetical protein